MHNVNQMRRSRKNEIANSAKRRRETRLLVSAGAGGFSGSLASLSILPVPCLGLASLGGEEICDHQGFLR